MRAPLELNPHRDLALRPERPQVSPRSVLHEQLPEFAPTRLVEAPAIADDWGVERVWVKDESLRCGLPSFKVLGASWSAYRVLLRESGLPLGASVRELRMAVGSTGRRLVTATDGNHGRAVARVARWFGVAATVYVPAGTPDERVRAIRDEGAVVEVVDGDYDDACETAANSLGDDGRLLADTYAPGHEDAARWVVEGYATLFEEIDEQLPARPDLVVVPMGVGSLCAAALHHYRAQDPAWPRVVGVEPSDAACVQESLRADRLVQTPGPHRSVAVGLNCGTASALAWPVLRAGLDATTTVTNEELEEAMRALASGGVTAGGTGAASAAGAARVLANAGAREALDLSARPRVLLLNTEGATEPSHYAAVMTRS